VAFPIRVTQSGKAFGGPAFLYSLTGTNAGGVAGSIVLHDSTAADNPKVTMNLSVQESNQFQWHGMEFKVGVYIVLTGGITEATVELG
jgi:hypothetical protein